MDWKTYIQSIGLLATAGLFILGFGYSIKSCHVETARIEANAQKDLIEALQGKGQHALPTSLHGKE